ncbi:3'(2'),5'-bisphosphate nucleotidase CysQ [Marinivivus vitaminiproducens]|uniref:3'(2'),5'-bisphosphate nucleotidase CysQ n=1 Tax=Marinivivus vitaminiproducens TaxID=3035935 RepID=UPI0027A43098|nr:3'(2'),5'-bisphosphate nucleotidase CysQ [Geminicoccaceae bacterium SCSIO 64248]
MTVSGHVRDGAARAVREAAALVLEAFGREDDPGWYKAPGALVTETDLAVDRLLRDRLGALDPAIGWLSEESADDPARLACERIWVVDPIDGTSAFAEGNPEFGVSVALVEHGRPVLAWFACPARDEFYEAARGNGAFRNGARLAVGERDVIAGGTVACRRGDAKRAWFREGMAGARLVPALSLACQLAAVAAGRIDGVLSRAPCKEWDTAAADLLIEEAGGRIEDATGAVPRYNKPEPLVPGMVAAGPGLLGPLRERLRNLRPPSVAAASPAPG